MTLGRNEWAPPRTPTSYKRQCGMVYGRRRLRSRSLRSIAPMWQRSLCLGKRHHWSNVIKAASYLCFQRAQGHLHPKGVGGQEHDVSTADEVRVPRARGQSARSCVVKTALFET